jgi:uncharacterized phage-associated protein
MISSCMLGNVLIGMAWREDRDLTPSSLHSLVFISHGWCLGVLEKPLISDPVQSTETGPIIKDLYETLKYDGQKNITRSLALNKSDFKRGLPTAEQRDIIQEVFDLYSPLTDYSMGVYVTGSKSLWNKSYRGKTDRIIENANISKYYYEQHQEFLRTQK